MWNCKQTQVDTTYKLASTLQTSFARLVLTGVKSCAESAPDPAVEQLNNLKVHIIFTTCYKVR